MGVRKWKTRRDRHRTPQSGSPPLSEFTYFAYFLLFCFKYRAAFVWWGGGGALLWVFGAVCALSLVVESRSFSLRCLLLLRLHGSRVPGLQLLWHMGLVAPQHVGSSRARDWTHVSCIFREILNHWTTREVPFACFWTLISHHSANSASYRTLSVSKKKPSETSVTFYFSNSRLVRNQKMMDCKGKCITV